MQKRVDEQTEDVAMPQVPKGTDQVTWFIPLKRFCARSHSGALCAGVVKVIRQEPFQQRTVSQIIGFQVAQHQRNPLKWISCLCLNPSQSTMLLLAISGALRKSACEIAPSNMFPSVRDERTSGRRAGLFTRACASACSGSNRAGLRG